MHEQRPLSAAGALLLVAVGLGGCRHPYEPDPPPNVTRTVGGERRTGAFVSPYAYEQFVVAELAEARGDLRAAADAYRLARTGPSDDPLLVARLADVLDRLGAHAEADDVLDEGESLDPESEAVWLARARIAARRQRPDEAIAALERAERAAPRSATAPVELAELLRARGADARAAAVLERYIHRAGPTDAGASRARMQLALARGDAEGAARAVQALLRVAPARQDEVRRVAALALAEGRPGLSLRILEHVPERAGDALRVEALLAAGRFDSAEALLTVVRPDDFGGTVALSDALLRAGRPDLAEELARAAAGGDTDPDARLALGRALLAQGRPAEAARSLAAIPPGTTAHVPARVALGQALRAAGRADLAAEALAAALADAPGSVALAGALADARLELEDADGALAAVAGDTPGLRLARARVLERLGRGPDAWALLAGLDDEPSLDEAARLRAAAEAAAARGDRGAAIDRLEALVRRAPEDQLARARLGALR